MKKISVFAVAYKNLLRKRTRSAADRPGHRHGGLGPGQPVRLQQGLRGLPQPGHRQPRLPDARRGQGLSLRGGDADAQGRHRPQIHGRGRSPASVAAEPEVDGVTPMLMQVVFDPNKGESGGVAAFLGVDPVTFPQAQERPAVQGRRLVRGARGGRGRLRLRGGRARAARGRRPLPHPREGGRGQGRRHPRADGDPGRRDDLPAPPDGPEDLRPPPADLDRHQGQEGRGHEGLRGQDVQAARRPGRQPEPGQDDHHDPGLDGPGHGLLDRPHRHPHRHDGRRQHGPDVGHGAAPGDRHPQVHGGHGRRRLQAGLARDDHPLPRAAASSAPGLALLTARLTDVLVRRLLPYSPSGGPRGHRRRAGPDDPGRGHRDRPGQRHLPVLEGGPDEAARHHPQRGGIMSARPPSRSKPSTCAGSTAAARRRSPPSTTSPSGSSKGTFLSVVGPSGSGQDDPHQRPRLSRQPDLGPARPRGPRRLRGRPGPLGGQADAHPAGRLRLHLPEILPHLHADRPRERHPALHLLQEAGRRGGRRARPEDPRPRQARRPPARPALGRGDAAGGHRPGPGQQARHPARRRADGQPRHGPERGDRRRSSRTSTNGRA
ncbi:MAG: hypothetical protein MZU95_06580 [Desulfomicrobium escambiense]|nr:hypothetical protein [Desulfomicrobium escambiense]